MHGSEVSESKPLGRVHVQYRVHVRATCNHPIPNQNLKIIFQELADLLSIYDMKRDLLELNFKAAQWTCGAVWNRWYMTPYR
jgi:hypothetical protein